jgi:hypothetical protein
LLELLLSQRDRVVTKEQIGQAWSPDGATPAAPARSRSTSTACAASWRAPACRSARHAAWATCSRPKRNRRELACAPKHWLRRGCPAPVRCTGSCFVWLLLPQVVLWIAGASFTYNLAVRYANEAIDASLAQASRSLARQIKPTASGLFIDLPRSARRSWRPTPPTACSTW